MSQGCAENQRDSTVRGSAQRLARGGNSVNVGGQNPKVRPLKGRTGPLHTLATQ